MTQHLGGVGGGCSVRPDVASQPEINKQAPIKMHQWQEAETQQRPFMHGASLHWLLELRREGGRGAETVI